MGYQQGNIRQQETQFLIVIPARYESVRLPGKPLLKISGKTLIQRVCEQLSGLSHHVVVATDNQLIYDHVSQLGFHVVMTSSTHPNGTSRCIECYEILKNNGYNYDVLINVQGDEPLIEADQISEISLPFEEFKDLKIGTLCKKITATEEKTNPNIVKVVKGKSKEGYPKALYFSRSDIPFDRDKQQNISSDQSYKHVGIYAFRTSILNDLKTLPPGNLEQIEKLEQLRWLESGLDIGVFETNFTNIGVDTTEDIKAVENFLKKSESF